METAAWPVRLDMVIRVRCGQPPVHSRPGCWLARWVGLGSTSPHTLPNQTRRHVFCQVAASNSTALRSRVRRCVVQACARRMPRRVLQTHVAAMVRRRPVWSRSVLGSPWPGRAGTADLERSSGRWRRYSVRWLCVPFYRRLWEEFVGGDAGRYGRVIWGTCWTIDRVASRAVR
jgi:hypothetical protein